MNNGIERTYESESGLEGFLDDLEEQEVRDRDNVRRYCERFGVRLVRIDSTFERSRPELMYFFSDGLGGYTIEGVRESLED